MPLPRPQLLAAAHAFFVDIAAETPSIYLLSHFSTTQEVFFDHSPDECGSGSLTGLNAIRSYFDILATHWTRHDVQEHHIAVYPESQRVIVQASVRWVWKASGRSWREEFTCTLDYDDHVKVKRLTVRTNSPPGTCVMRAVDKK
jgi:hypothetical protein